MTTKQALLLVKKSRRERTQNVPAWEQEKWREKLFLKKAGRELGGPPPGKQVNLAEITFATLFVRDPKKMPGRKPFFQPGTGGSLKLKHQ